MTAGSCMTCVCIGATGESRHTEHARAIEAGALHAEYQANEVGADARWRGKLAQVTGYVGSILKSAITDAPIVTLRADPNGYSDDVNCTLRQDSEALRISKGARVTYRGRVNGMTLGTVMLDDCVFVPGAPAAPHPAPRPSTQPRRR